MKRPGIPYTQVEIDADILPLVRVMNGELITTLGCCAGHGKKRAYVDFAVRGLDGMRAFVEAIDAVDFAFADDALIEVRLNYSHEVLTACDFKMFPEWVMLSLKIEGHGKNGAPSKALLARIAAEFGRLYNGT